MMNLLVKINALLPFGLTLHRVAVLAIGIVYLISGLGSTAFWAFKYAGNERFVPFGLSTFRALNWPLSDFVLIFCCFYAALTCIPNSRKAPTGCIVGGAGFLAQGFLGLYIDSSRDTREQFGIEAAELQPIFLNLWFVGWGALSVWAGVQGLNLLLRVQTQTL